MAPTPRYKPGRETWVQYSPVAIITDDGRLERTPSGEIYFRQWRQRMRAFQSLHKARFGHWTRRDYLRRAKLPQ